MIRRGGGSLGGGGGGLSGCGGGGGNRYGGRGGEKHVANYIQSNVKLVVVGWWVDSVG